MRLKSLELLGFKSFGDRTVIHFEEGVTGIVGPNGCGKSNVVDAIRWVMGEQSAKHLRGGQMEDVIFNGCDTRAPMGMASVFLTFDNSDGRAPAEYADYSEITVGRRLYRSGESEYFINKAPCRLKDIIDLFLGTGIGTKAYSIIEQGRVESIVSSKPEERRVFIEEVAGISKFKMRKESAIRKMEATKANLLRLADIIAELEKQINSLKRQVGKAERYKKFSTELKTADLNLASHQFDVFSRELAEVEIKFQSVTEIEAANASIVSRQENEIETGRMELTGIEQHLDTIQRQLYESQNAIRIQESRTQLKTKEIEQFTFREKTLQDEEIELKGKRVTNSEELTLINLNKADSDLQLAAVREDALNAEGELNILKADYETIVSMVQEGRDAIIESVEKVSENNLKLKQFDQRLVDLTARMAGSESEIDSIDRRVVELNDQLSRERMLLDETRGNKTRIEEERAATADNHQRLENEQNEQENSLKPLRETVANKRSRLHSLKEIERNREGFDDGVRAVMKRKEEIDSTLAGVVGTVSEIVETNPEYETAVGAVLGEKLQYVIVKSHEEGVEAIEYLNAAATGRGTFIPIGLRTKEAQEEAAPDVVGEGVIGHLINHVRFTDDYHKIAKYLFDDVVLVDNLRKALDLWSVGSGEKTYVTLSGEVVDPIGIVSGGFGASNARQILSQKREIRELEDETANLAAEQARREETLADCSRRVRSHDERLSLLEQQHHETELKIVQQEMQLSHISQEAQRLTRRRDDLTVQLAQMAEEQKRMEVEHEAAAQDLDSFASRKEEIGKGLSEYEMKEAVMRQDLVRMTDRLTELKMKLASREEQNVSMEKEITRLIQSLVDTQMSIDDRIDEMFSGQQKVVSIRRETRFADAAIKALVNDVNKAQDEQRVLKEQYDQLSEVVKLKEMEVREARKKKEEATAEKHTLELQLTQLKERVYFLNRDLFEKYRIDLEKEYRNYLVENFNIELEAQNVADLKGKLENLGSVNVDAITEYEELKTRYDFLSQQYNDLNTSLDSLATAIQKINRTSRQRFREAFEAVNERFQVLFPRMFRGGKGYLNLTDENNLLESGVEIFAQPPGKKLQSVTLLSGGEKALTAVALIFSIFLVKPSPFCLLDEVDAPLDDANIDRFNDIIREMTKKSQFILITHNKRTMELADTLYGVTMEEAGASKIISVKLGERDKGDSIAAA